MKKLYIRYDSPSAGGTMRTIHIRTEDVKELSNILDTVQLSHWKHEDEIEVTASNFKSFMEVAYQNDYESIPEDKQAEKRIKDIKVPEPLPLKDKVEYPSFKMEPLQIQKEGVLYGLEKERFLLADIMGPQPLWAKVHTPNGWTTMGELKVGDYVTGQDGKPKEVKEVIEQGEDTVYEITFSDRTKAYSTGNHLWEVRSPSQKSAGNGFQIKPLKALIGDLTYANGYNKHFVPLVEPIEYEGAQHVEDAYMIGLYVGDGGLNKKTPTMTTEDEEVREAMREVAGRYGCTVSQHKDPLSSSIIGSFNDQGRRENKWTEYMREVGVMGRRSTEANVPDVIKYGTVETRKEFLRGLFDADGTTGTVQNKKDTKASPKKGAFVDIVLSSKELLEDVAEMIRALGGTATTYEKEVEGKTYYRAYLRPNFVPFKLKRKVDKFQVKDPTKAIVSIEKYSYEDTRCISVEDSLYLTDGHTVTHNTGKTGTAMYLAEYLMGHYDFKHVLVINGVYNNQFNWEKEVGEFLYSDARILGIRDKRNGGRRVGSGTEKLEDLENGIDETYIITNIATIRNDKIVDKLVEMIYNNTIGMVIVDEIHYCIGGSSKQGKNLQKLRPRFRLGMSGSPFNEPTDMYDIEAWLGTTYLNRSDYKNQYGVEQVTDKTRMIAAKRRRMPFAEYFFNQPEKFSEDISRFMLRRTDVLKGLPGITFTDYLVEMGNLQRQAYDQISAEVGIDLNILSLDQLEEELSGSEYMNERKMMSCPHVFDVNEDVKLDAIKTLLTEIIANDKTAIVYGFFIETIKNYEKELSKEFPGKGNYVTADTEDVFQVIDDFQNGKGNFLVGGVKKIGTGFNITRADYVIYADRPATWNDYEQSYMRAWRRGRKDPVRVIKVLCVDTWDDKMSWKLLERKAQSDKILGANQTAENVIDGRYE